MEGRQGHCDLCPENLLFGLMAIPVQCGPGVQEWLDTQEPEPLGTR